MYKSKYFRNFVESNSTRYEYAYPEVRDKFVCDRAQATCQDCEVRSDAGEDNTPCQYSFGYGQEWEKGLDATLSRKKRVTPPVEAKVTGEVEAHIIALACAEPPKGYAKWTLRLLADRSVKLGYIDSISHTQVGRILKNEHKPHLKKRWCIPPSQSSSFVAAMEDVLEV